MFFLLCTMDSKVFNISISNGIRDFWNVRYQIGNGCLFLLYRQEKNELWAPASNANTFALLDDTIELRSKICLIAVLN